MRYVSARLDGTDVLHFRLSRRSQKPHTAAARYLLTICFYMDQRILHNEELTGSLVNILFKYCDDDVATVLHA
jgi:hypothetical protein